MTEIQWPTKINDRTSAAMREYVEDMRKKNPNETNDNILRKACGYFISEEGTLLGMMYIPTIEAANYSVIGKLLMDPKEFLQLYKKTVEAGTGRLSEKELGYMSTEMLIGADEIKKCLSEDPTGLTLSDKLAEVKIPSVRAAARRFKQFYQHLSG